MSISKMTTDTPVPFTQNLRSHSRMNRHADTHHTPQGGRMADPTVNQTRTTAAAAPAEPTFSGRSYADYATDILRDRLITLEIAPSTPLNDEQIGKELGVGRTPVREAIKRLESERLVTVYPRRGTFAASIDITDLAHITELRLHLEPIGAERATEHATIEDRARMRGLMRELESLSLQDSDASHLMRLDLAVHRLIYSASGNPHLEETLTRLDNLATRIWCLVIDRLPDINSHITEHIDLLSRITDGDAAGAAITARDHVVAFERLVRSAI